MEWRTLGVRDFMRVPAPAARTMTAAGDSTSAAPRGSTVAYGPGRGGGVVPPSGLEPETSEPKSEVLPITPWRIHVRRSAPIPGLSVQAVGGTRRRGRGPILSFTGDRQDQTPGARAPRSGQAACARLPSWRLMRLPGRGPRA